MGRFDSYMDLFKAKRDLTKLVQVERTVTNRNGTTFQRKYYVQPNEVLKTDKVIGNQQVLDNWKKQVQNPPKSGVLDSKYFDAIKHNRDKALQYLKDCGLSWKPDQHPAINWMHAMQVYTQAVKNATGQPQTASATQPVTKQTQATTPPPANHTTTSSVKLTDSQQKEVDACKNGRDKVVTIKKLLGRDGCMTYAKSIGVTWNEHQHPAINNMRMSTALTEYFDKMDGTISPTKAKSGKGGGAPLGNDNAKKDTTTNTDDNTTKSVEPEEIEITNGMKPREVAIANLLNKVTSRSDLNLFKSLGMVAEDDAAKSFMEKQLYDGYYKKNRINSKQGIGSLYSGRYGGDEFAKNSIENSEISKCFKGIPKKLLKKGIATLGSDLSIATTLYPRDSLAPFSAAESYRSVEVTIGGEECDGRRVDFTRMLLDIHFRFSTLSDEENNTKNLDGSDRYRMTAAGVSGDDFATSEDLKRQFDKHGINSYGVANIINEIASRNPEVKDEADKMISTYQRILELTGYNPTKIESYISSSYEGKFKKQKQRLISQTDATDMLLNKLKEFKTMYKLDDADMYTTIYNCSRGWNDHYLRKKDGSYVRENGNLIDLTVIMQRMTVPSDPNGGSVWDNLGTYTSRDYAFADLAVAYATGKKCVDLTLDDVSSSKDTIKNVMASDPNVKWSGDTITSTFTYRSLNDVTMKNNTIQESKFTPEQYNEIRNKMLEFTGQKIIKYNQSTGNYDDVDTSAWTLNDWNEYDEDSSKFYGLYGTNRTYMVTSNGDNTAKDLILANMAYATVNASACNSIADNVLSDCSNSAANGNGSDHSANFDYMRSNTILGRVRKYTDEGSPMTSKQINDSVKKNISETPLLSSKRIQDLKDYVDENGEDTKSYVDSNNMAKTNYREQFGKVAKAGEYRVLKNTDISSFNGTPIYDMFVEQLQSIAVKCPQNKNSRIKTDDDVKSVVSKNLNYVPYSSDKQAKELTGSALKAAREDAMSKINCTLASATKSDYSSIDSRVKHDWDKEKRNSSGKRLYGHISFVNHGVYEIKNSKQQDTFEETKKKTGGKVTSLFHGTDFRGGAGILGVTGGWLIPKDSSDAARMGIKYAGGMLGRGVYLADLAGKSAGYFGNWGSGYNTRGSLIICDAILGNCVEDSSYGMVRDRYDCDSVCMKAGTNTGRTVLRADEWCVRKNDHVAPRFIIDAEAKSRV